MNLQEAARLWHSVRARVRSIAFRGRRETDLREELQLHLERETERLQAQGLSRDDAQFAARRAFGGVEQIKEECRDARGTAVFDKLARDTRYGFRRLVREWRFTAAAVLILGVAIGANAAIFSLVNAVLFREQAVSRPDRIVNLYQNDAAGQPLIVSRYAVYQEMAAYTQIFSTVAASLPDTVRYLQDGAVRPAVAEYATASYLNVLGLRPSLGRWFDPAEERPGARPVVVLGHRTWTRAFRADPGVVGRVVRIEGMAATVVGVAPAGYRGTVDIGLGTDFWLPLATSPAMKAAPVQELSTLVAPLLVKARLRDGVTVPQASAAMNVLAQRLVVEHPEWFRRDASSSLGRGITAVASSEVRMHPQADTPIMALASLVLVIVGLVLAIACSNVATLLLVRGAARAKEVSVRLAMGATRHDLVRYLLAESVLLSLAAGIAGCVLAWWGMRVLESIDLPITVDLTPDYRVLLFAVTLSVVTGVLFGLAPALKATSVDLWPTLRGEGLQPLDHRRLTLKNGLIVVQVAISVLLLGATSIFLQHAAAASAHRAGYAVEGVALLETDMRFAGYPDDRATSAYDDLLRRTQAIPGVESAALQRGLPMEAIGGGTIVVDSATGGNTTSGGAIEMGAGPGYFETLRIPLLHGRTFDARDRADAPPVAVITDRMARQFFGTDNAVGRRFRLAANRESWMEVIGVVRDTGTGRFVDDVLDPIDPPYYRPYAQSGATATTVVARTSGDAAPLLAAMQRELRAIDIMLPVMTAQTMAQRLQTARATPAAAATLLGALGGLGLLLAGIGLYAVIAFAVARRTREIGVRMALGARSQQVVWSIARGVAALVGVGTVIGLVLSVLTMLLLRGSMGDIGIGDIALLNYRPTVDPVALLAIAAATALAGVAAAFVPSRRAALMDPLVALRHE